jgi:hypothetical protein
MWLEDAELAPPPRRVTLGATLEVLLGGVLFQVCSGLLLFFSVFGWVFAGQADLTGWLRFAGQLETAEGTLLLVESTASSVGEQTVWAHRYRFQGPDGQVREDVSYREGSQGSAGDAITVEFPAGTPSVSRIVGQRRGVFPFGTAFVLLLPLVPGVLALIGLRTGLRRARLLRHGRVTDGEFVGKEATGASVNDQPVWKLNFRFRDEDGQEHHTSTKTHDAAALIDEPRERLLYDPRDTDRAELLDALPGQGRTTPDGGWEAVSLRGPLLKLLLPGLLLAENLLLARFVL